MKRVAKLAQIFSGLECMHLLKMKQGIFTDSILLLFECIWGFITLIIHFNTTF